MAAARFAERQLEQRTENLVSRTEIAWTVEQLLLNAKRKLKTLPRKLVALAAGVTADWQLASIWEKAIRQQLIELANFKIRGKPPPAVRRANA